MSRTKSRASGYLFMTRTAVYASRPRRVWEQLKQDGETRDVRWVPYQSEEAVCRLGTGYRSGRPEAAFLIEPDGNIKQGLDAFLPLLPGLRGGRLLQAFTRIPFLKPLAYALYRFVARYRYRLFGAVAVEEKI